MESGCDALHLGEEFVGLFVDSRLSNQPFFVFVVVVEDVLECRVSKHSLPTIIFEVWKVVGGSGNGSEPIVKDDVKLRSDVIGLRVENKRDRAGVFPAWQFLSV